MRYTFLFLIAGVSLLMTAGGLQFSRGDANAGTPTLFAVDADLTAGGVQAARPGTVALTNNFSVETVLTSLGGGVVYQAYQIGIQYDDVVFDAVGAPANWSDAPVLDTTAGNIAVFGDSLTPVCDPSPPGNAYTEDDDSGVALVTMTCAQQGLPGTTVYTGPLTGFVFQCDQNGTGTIELVLIDTYLLDNSFANINDGVASATVTCGTGTAPTSTSTSTPVNTNTPVTPQTASPTATETPTTPTATPTRTPPPDQVLITPTPRAGITGGQPPVAGTPVPGSTQTGGPGGNIVGPDTGSGDGSAGDSPTLMALLLAAGVTLIALGLVPIGRRTLSRARGTRGG